MQRADQYYLKEWGVFYASRVIGEQLPKGKSGWNYALKKVYLIFLLEFDMKGSGDGYLHDYCLMDRQTGQVFYEKLIKLPVADSLTNCLKNIAGSDFSGTFISLAS